ncbi:MAG TPA: high-affinity nickel-transport family protein [Polyangiaceae bacterium]
MSPLAVLGLGFVLGMRHATDVDHVAAVTALAGRERSLRAALSLGTLWGVGHTLTVVLVGGAMVAFGLVIPERVGLSLELLVAVMLVVLGVMNFSRSGHAHGVSRPVPPARPLIVGVVHGLAGSAAVALLVLTTIREPGWALSYLVLFGLGTILGMALLTASITLPLGALAERFRGFDRHLVRGLGVVSIAVGVWLAYQVGFVDGLFLPEPLAVK